MKKLHNHGLTAYQIKLIALITMTIDHLAVYGWEIPIFSQYSFYLRVIGRIAAPLFLFLITESVHHTRNKPRFVLRLYVAAVGVGLITAVTNYFFYDTVGRFGGNNILFTYFYTALYILLIEQILGAIKERKRKEAVLGALLLLSTAVPGLVSDWLINLVTKLVRNPSLRDVGWDLVKSFVVGPLEVPYTIAFVILGVLLYFAGSKYKKALLVVAGSIACTCYDQLRYLSWGSDPPLFLYYLQFWMILAVPFILLYNGEKGKGNKCFFYVYYPTHRWLIAAAGYLYTVFFAN